MKLEDAFTIFKMGENANRPRRRRHRPHYHHEEISITRFLQQELERSEALTKFLKDYEKANKKEDKKESKFNVNQLALGLIVTFPIIAPLYVAFLKSLW